MKCNTLPSRPSLTGWSSRRQPVPGWCPPLASLLTARLTAGVRLLHMNRALLIAALAILSHPVSAKEIRTELFTVDVPSEWKVEDNKQSIVLAMGPSMAGGLPTPFLSIQYCSSGEVDGKNLVKCNEQCSDKSLSLLLKKRLSGIVFSPITEEKNESGDVAFHSEANADGKVSVAATMVCGIKGNIYISLVSENSTTTSTRLLKTVQRSLRWR